MPYSVPLIPTFPLVLLPSVLPLIPHPLRVCAFETFGIFHEPREFKKPRGRETMAQTCSLHTQTRQLLAFFL